MITNTWPEPIANALAIWALETVESLHYLVELHDEMLDEKQTTVHDVPTYVVSLGYVRWATVSAVTAGENQSGLAHLS
jgi:hypothetical protein